MSEERVTIDLIVNDEAARAKVAQFVTSLGSNAKVVGTNVAGWTEGVNRFSGSLQNMVMAGGVLWTARKMAMDMKDAFFAVSDKRMANVDFAQQVEKRWASLAHNLMMDPATGKQVSVPEAKATVRRIQDASGMKTMDLLDLHEKMQGMAAGLSVAEAERVETSVAKWAARSGVGGEAAGGIGEAAIMAYQSLRPAGYSSDAALGVILQGQNLSPISSPELYAKYLVPLFRNMTPRFKADELMAVSAVAGHAMGDTEGARTQTFMSTINQGFARFRKLPGVNLPENFGLIEALAEVNRYLEKAELPTAEGGRGWDESRVYAFIQQYFPGFRGGASRSAGRSMFTMFGKAPRWERMKKVDEQGRETEYSATERRSLAQLYDLIASAMPGATAEGAREFYEATITGTTTPMGQMVQSANRAEVLAEQYKIDQSVRDQMRGTLEKNLITAFAATGASSESFKQKVRAYWNLKTAGNAPLMETYFNVTTAIGRKLSGRRGADEQTEDLISSLMVDSGGIAARAMSSQSERDTAAGIFFGLAESAGTAFGAPQDVMARNRAVLETVRSAPIAPRLSSLQTAANVLASPFTLVGDVFTAGATGREGVAGDKIAVLLEKVVDRMAKAADNLFQSTAKPNTAAIDNPNGM